jgi:hypothetical protein
MTDLIFSIHCNSWIINVIDGLLLIVVHATMRPMGNEGCNNTPTSSSSNSFYRHVYDSKYVYGVWLLEVHSLTSNPFLFLEHNNYRQLIDIHLLCGAYQQCIIIINFYCTGNFESFARTVQCHSLWWSVYDILDLVMSQVQVARDCLRLQLERGVHRC